jgi:hypothetical protein
VFLASWLGNTTEVDIPIADLDCEVRIENRNRQSADNGVQRLEHLDSTNGSGISMGTTDVIESAIRNPKSAIASVGVL